ncbi:ATP-dependent DNA ligase [archaeon]|jgi:DNA ligase 1|nr:ATP-dependent DNA ligase [archaeon]
MEYEKICKAYEALSLTSKGLEKTKILAEFLDGIGENPEYIYLFQGRVFPDYDPRELGVSTQILIKAISKSSGHSEYNIISKLKEEGDLGLAVFELFETKKQQGLFTKKLTVDMVLSNLKKIPDLEGKGTVQTKVDLIVDLLHSASAIESKYIARTVMGDLKVGVGSGIIRDSIVESCFSPKTQEEKKKFAEEVQTAYNKATDFAIVLQKARKNKLSDIELSVGRPVRVMLYPKAKGSADAFRIVGKPATFEYKYDGFRMMINKDEEGHVKLFTRRLEDVSHQFPDLVKFVEDNVNAKSFIIDSEAVGYDPKTNTYKEFQAISQRIKRKYEIEKLIKELPVGLRVFDIIYLEGESLINKGYQERRTILENVVHEDDWKIELAKQITTDNEDEAEEFFKKAIDEGQEGLMVKGLDKIYKPGARIGYGVKWKPEDNDFDLVITGAEWGTGKRAGTLTSFDVACQDESGELLDIGKVSGGLKEKEEEGLSYGEMTEMLTPEIISEEGRHIKVKPLLVVTVQYQNIQKSPSYSSGYALRFPRITRLRPDRTAEDVATIGEVEKEVIV